MLIDGKDKVKWREELKLYENNKKKSLSSNLYNKNSIISHKQIKEKEFEFNPILNKYKNEQKDTLYIQSQTEIKKKLKPLPKHNILTLEGIPENSIKTNKKFFDKAKPFNIINNNVTRPGDPALKNKTKKIYNNVFRDFNIVSNKYWNEHEKRFHDEKEKIKKKLLSDLQTKNVFNPINCEFYDKKFEEEFLKIRDKNDEERPKKYFDKLPKSYKVRETIQLKGGNKNEKISKETDLFEKNKRNPLEKFKKRYEIEKEKKTKCEADFEKENSNLNRYYVDKFIDDYKTGYHPINLKEIHNQDLHLENARGKKENLNQQKLWEKLA